jgi:6-phosphogluconolactonase (cycloisomerase 2 family)
MVGKRGLLGGNGGSNSGMLSLENSPSYVRDLIDGRRYAINTEYSSMFSGVFRNSANTITGLHIDDDQSKCYIASDLSDRIYQYDFDEGAIAPNPLNYKTATLTEQGLPSGIHFKDDGTKVYIIGSSSAAIHQYSLSTAWDISTISYDSKTFTVSSQDSAPRGMFIRPDTGTTLYVLGDTNDRVFQYSLSTAWDISTASYSAVSFLFSAVTTAPTDIWFGDSGTKFYITSSTGVIYQYNMSTAWTISSASFSTSTSASTNFDSNLQGIYITSDGGHAFLVGTGSDSIGVLQLATPWNIGTASYQNSFYRFESVPLPLPSTSSNVGIYFSSDGTKVYMMNSGLSNTEISQLSMDSAWNIDTINTVPNYFIGRLSTSLTGVYLEPSGEAMYATSTSDIFKIPLLTPFDISTGCNSSSMSVSTQEGAGTAIAFKDDGTKLYLLGQVNDRVYQYELRTAWDIRTAYYSNKSFLVSSQEANSSAIFFKPDGTKFYIVGVTNDTIYQYSLGTAWDISTASYDTKSFSVASQDGSPVGIYIKSDGTKLYVIGDLNNRIYQYSLGTTWDISTASYDSVNFLINEDASPISISFKDDGTKLFIGGDTNNRVYQYSLGTAWNISTASYDSVYFDFGGLYTGTGTASSAYFGDSGSQIYILNNTNDRIDSFSFKTAWNINSGIQRYQASLQDTDTQDIFFEPDGTKAFTVGGTSDNVYEYSLSTPWNLLTISHNTSNRLSIGSYDATPRALCFSNDGKILIVGGQTNRIVQLFYLQTPWSVTTAINLDLNKKFSPSISAIDTLAGGLFFKSDGKKVYILGDNNNRVYQFSLRDAWDVINLTYDSVSFSVSAQDSGTLVAIFFKPDGTKFYIIGSNDRVYQYSLGTAWDISTASYDSKSFLVTTQDSNPQDLFFKNDGTKLYVMGDFNNRIYQYSLGTAWDVSTVSYDYKSLHINASTVDITITSFFISDDGTRLFCGGTGSDVIQDFTMYTPWDVSTAYATGNRINVASEEQTHSGISFSPDGKNLYLIGPVSDRITQYILNTPWNISSNIYNSFRPTMQQQAMSEPVGLHISKDNSKIYVLGSAADLGRYDILE